MSDFRLVLRIIRGGGAAGLIRLGLMVVGLAAGVGVVVFLASVPSVLAERGRAAAARQPISADDQAPEKFQFQLAFGSWRGVRSTRVLVAGLAGEIPPPPGVVRAPAAGEVVLSPAAASLASRDSEFAKQVRGRRIGEIGPAGLLGPDELYAYVGTTPDQLGQPLSGRGWGGYASDAEVRHQFAEVPRQLALIIVGPVIIYLNVCARLASTTRVRRYAALRLVGMSRRRVLRIAGLESAVAGAGGAVLGLAGYAVANRVIGPSGAVGFSWYSATSAVSTSMAVATVGLVGVAAGVIGALNTSRALSRPIEARTDPADRPARWWYAMPFVFGLGLAGYPMFTSAGEPRRQGAVAGVLLLAGIVLASVGLLLSLRPMLVGVGRWVARRRLPVSVRLAARRIEHESSGLSWHAAGLCLLALVGSIGAGVLRQAELTATPDPQRLTVHLYTQDVPTAVRDRVYALPAAGRWLVYSSIVEAPRTAGERPSTVDDYVRLVGVRLVVATCAVLRQVAAASLDACRDGHRYLLRTPATGTGPPSLAPGAPVRFRDADGGVATLAAPDETLDLPFVGVLPSGMTILVAGTVSPIGLPADGIFYYLLPADIVGVDAFASELASLAPAVTMSVINLDLTGLEAYRVHRGTIRVGVLVAFLLGLLAFLVSSAVRAVERRRQVAALVVVGARRRMLRAVALWQLFIPLALALALATLTGHVAGNAVLRLEGEQVGWYTGTLEAVLPLIAIAFVGAALVGSIVVGARPRAEDLRRE